MNGELKHIELTDKGFQLIIGGRPAAEFDWVHITEIVAYRRDPEGADLLCLGFRGAASKEYVEVDEETDGYSQLLPALYDAFPAISRDWWQDVAKPLGTNRQTIYGMAMSEENEEPAASKYLKSLHLKKTRQRKLFRNTLILLVLGVILGIIAGILFAESESTRKWWFIVTGGAIEFVISVGMLRRVRPVLLVMGAFALICWLATLLGQGRYILFLKDLRVVRPSRKNMYRPNFIRNFRRPPERAVF